MSEPRINIATGFNGGVSVSLRADTAAELEALLADASSSPTLSTLLATAGVVPGMAQAVATVQAAFPGASPVSTVGQPLPQPGANAFTPAVPPTVVNPGPCQHGQRVWKDSIARGSSWQRWECALPWTKGNDAHNASRCKPVNA